MCQHLTVRPLSSHAQEIVKFEVIAKETDPDKKLYGEKMVQKVLALVERWNANIEQANALVERADAQAAPALGALLGAGNLLAVQNCVYMQFWSHGTGCTFI